MVLHPETDSRFGQEQRRCFVVFLFLGRYAEKS
jgi:hypothetical protein